MKYENVPPCPRSNILQHFYYVLVFIALTLCPGLLMFAGVDAISETGTTLHNVLTGASSIFCLIVAVKAISAMEKKYDDQCYAWELYWNEHWQHVHELEVQIESLPVSASDSELKRLKQELATMQSIRNRCESRYANQKTQGHGTHKVIAFVVILIVLFFFGYFLCSRVLSCSTSSNSSKPVKSTNPIPFHTSTPTPTSSLASFYQRNYPMTWGYIEKYAADPYTYIDYYHSVWGRLQAYRGDGIVFDTLTPFEQQLVNYPSIGSIVYFSSFDGIQYHSTRKCYTLLNSSPVGKNAWPSNMKYPCSKCVAQ